LHITGDITYLHYSTTAHLLPMYREQSSSSCFSLPSLLEPSSSFRPLQNTLKTQQLKRSPLPQVYLPFSYTLSPAPLVTKLPLSLRLRALHPSYMSIHTFSTFPHLHYTDGGSWPFILPSHIFLHVALSTVASSVTTILCSCSKLFPGLILA